VSLNSVEAVAPQKTEKRAGEVFLAFLKLGLTSFGGPVAHLGYFRAEFVERRAWLDEPAYADLVALCQFLPGPSSSQVGIAIGLSRAGYLGALAAWTGFTTPSAILLLLFGFGIGRLGDAAGSSSLHGLKIAAVAVVALAVLQMARSLAPDRSRATLAVAATALALLLPTTLGQLGAIALGAAIGLALLRDGRTSEKGRLPLVVGRGVALASLFFVLRLVDRLAVFRKRHRKPGRAAL